MCLVETTSPRKAYVWEKSLQGYPLAVRKGLLSDRRFREIEPDFKILTLTPELPQCTFQNSTPSPLEPVFDRRSIEAGDLISFSLHNKFLGLMSSKSTPWLEEIKISFTNAMQAFCLQNMTFKFATNCSVPIIFLPKSPVPLKAVTHPSLSLKVSFPHNDQVLQVLDV